MRYYDSRMFPFAHYNILAFYVDLNSKVDISRTFISVFK